MTTRSVPSAAAIAAPFSTTPARQAVGGVRRLLAAPMPRGLWAWLGPLLVTALGGGLRVWRIGSPRAVVFDETYYAKDGYSLLLHGHERAWVEGADARLLTQDPSSLLTGNPAYVVHPPIGKWVIALGEWAFGMNPVGWRMGVAVLGTLTILLTARAAMRLTRSILLGCTAGLLLALDGLHFVMSRTALLDGVLAFFLVAAFACLLVDRDRKRDRLTALTGTGGQRHRRRRRAAEEPGRGGPRLGLRPWRWAAGVCLGLAIGTKWSGLPFVAGFGLLALLWDVDLRRRLAVRRPYIGTLSLDAVPALAALVVLPVLVYLASWSGWLFTDGGFDRHWAEGRGTSWPIVPEAMRSLWHYHAEMWRFHTRLTEHHPYQSSPWGWLVLARPVSFYFVQFGTGQHGCTTGTCVREVIGLGTPALWWTSVAAVAYLLWRWAGPRDWRAGAVLVGIAAGWLPWFRYQDRPIFFFYAVAFVPFLVLGVTLLLGALLGDRDASAGRRAVGALAVGALVVLVVVQFFAFQPVLTAETITRADWNRLMWLPSWV